MFGEKPWNTCKAGASWQFVEWSVALTKAYNLIF
jgi:hypothetical protein